MQEAEIRPRALQVVAGTEGADYRRALLKDRTRHGEGDHIATGSGMGGAPRILIVEDDALTCIDIEYMLEELGYEVSGVANHVGPAMDFLSRNAGTIDCAILDIQLAGRTCLPIVQALNELGVPYLFVTGHDTETVRKLGLVGHVIEKPFVHRHLDAHLSALVA